MSRCDHIGQTDEARHVVLCAAGYSVLWLLRIIRKEGISHFLSIIEARGFATCLRVIQSPATIKPPSGFKPQTERAFT